MNKANTPKFLFTDSTLPLILEAFGKKIEDGLIVEIESGEPVLTSDNQEIEVSNFGGLKKGSEIFIKDDLFSIMNLAEDKI